MKRDGMNQRTISKDAARRFLITKQGFQRAKGKDGTLETIKRLECVQIDPVCVVHRNHHLVLHSRISDYKPSYLEGLLYKDRSVFEYWCNEKSIVPMEEFRFFRYRMTNYTEFHSPFYERLKARRKELNGAIRRVLSAINGGGPMCAREFSAEEDVGSKTGRRVLNLLWDCGEVMIHHVEGNRRYYDLTERILPAGLCMELPSRDEYDRFMTEKYMRAYGLIDVRDWRFGWLGLKASKRKATVTKMAEEGKVYPVRMEGVKHVYYVLENYLGFLEAAEDSPVEEKVHLIAPLDNFIWNRRMISEIFDFEYSWEIYKIPEKRRYGYYVLPILYGARFVGRIDPKLDRGSKIMIINSIILEENHFKKGLVAELAGALRNFFRFHDALHVKIVKTKPKQLKNALSSQLSQLAG